MHGYERRAAGCPIPVNHFLGIVPRWVAWGFIGCKKHGFPHYSLFSSRYCRSFRTGLSMSLRGIRSPGHQPLSDVRPPAIALEP